MRDYTLYLNDILSAIIKIEDYSKDSSYEKFQLNGMLQDAVIRNIEIIGEAVKKIPDVIKLVGSPIVMLKFPSISDHFLNPEFSLPV